MRRFALLLALGALVLFPTTTFAAPAEQDCRSHSYTYDPGKTVEGFEAEATDGCHRVRWTGSIGQGAGNGSVTFKVTHRVNPWDGDLPSMAGDYCRARAAHEANLYFVNLFAVPAGTEVTVSYRCS